MEKLALVGCWDLVSFTQTQPDGTATYPYGDTPVGSVMYLDDGYFGAQLIEHNTSGKIAGSTRNVLSICGTYTADAATYTFYVQCTNGSGIIDPDQGNLRQWSVVRGRPPQLTVEWTQNGDHISVLWNRIT